MLTLTEAQTRYDLIDPALKRAGWDLANPLQVRVEVPIDGLDPDLWHRLLRKRNLPPEQLPQGVCDYALYHPGGEILAVVEAKRTAIHPLLAQAQTEFYARTLAPRQSFLPFAFLSNGLRTDFWDIDHANPREVAGFFAQKDLENLLFIRRNRVPLTSVPIDRAITDRPYQLEGIQRICQAFEDQNKRRALLVMATGTGKTRVAMSLVDVFMRANQARRILFVADRDALVRQALTEGFEEHLPHEPCARILTPLGDAVRSCRLFAVTLQTLSNCFEEFTPASFDLIIFDEVHRSIFNKWNEVLHYFDGRMIGLTATPAQYIDRNTFLEFDCPDQTPTFLYSRQEAADEGYLVDYELYGAQTHFQRAGIRGADLSADDRQALIDRGIDPDALDFSGTDLEQTVSNRDTLRRQWEEIWDTCLKDESGQLPGKTIVFAMTQDHALRLLEVFDEIFPQYPDLTRVITYRSEHHGTAVEGFKRNSRPRIAISVDMLETGVNIPEAVNLVFMRPIQSPIKLEQMVGRGTRSHAACTHFDWLPGGHKTRFLIIDFWENDFEPGPATQEAPQVPVLARLFGTRLDMLACCLAEQQIPEARLAVAGLRELVAAIPREAYSVRKVYPEVEHAWEDSFWLYSTPEKLQFLRTKVAPLLRFAPISDVDGVVFSTKVERLKLERKTGRDPSATLSSIADDVSRLPGFVYDDPARARAALLCQDPQALRTAPVDRLQEVIETLAPQMKNRRREASTILIDLPDQIEARSYIILDSRGEPVYAQEYRERVQRCVNDLLRDNPTLAALARGETVPDAELIELERLLDQELGAPDLQLSPGTIHRAFALRVGCLLEFLRRLLDIEAIPDYADIVRRQVQTFISARDLGANQILFLRTLGSVLAQKHRVTWSDLAASPFTALGADPLGRWFSEAQAQEIMAFAEGLAIQPTAPAGAIPA